MVSGMMEQWNANVSAHVAQNTFAGDLLISFFIYRLLEFERNSFIVNDET